MSDLILNARARLHVLAIDTQHHDQREHRRLTVAEHTALNVVLDEMHRLHVAVSDQRKRLDEYETPKKQAAPRPAATRSHAPTTHSTPEKPKSPRPAARKAAGTKEGR